MNALNILAKALNKKAANFYFSGTKDKRGDTVQKVVAKGVGIREFSSNLLDPNKWQFTNIFVSNIKEVGEMTKLGDLYGNRFTLALRLLENYDEKQLRENMESLKNFGFINYFGEQRFGTKDIRTFETGKLLLKKKYKEAFYSVLEADQSDQ